MKEKIEDVKRHLRENKERYIIGGVCLVVGAAGGVTAVAITSGKVSATQKIYALWAPNATQLMEQNYMMVRRGHPGFVIQDVATGEKWASIAEAATKNGLSRTDLQRHLQGLKPSIKGRTFRKLGEAQSPA